VTASEGSTCVFCDIVAGKAPAYRILENDSAVVILDIQPFARGHCLVLSKRHAQFWHQLTREEASGLFDAAHAAADRLVSVLEPDFVCMYARGRRIPHTHLFLIPTFGGDVLDRFFNALEGFQESATTLAELRSPSAMDETARALRDDR
jgi:histidine triad (HIT) family protein